MYDVIGALLPLALAISLSPFPVIAIVLLLLSRSPRANSTAFTTAWMLSNLTSTIVFTAIAKLIEPDDTSGPDPLAGVIRLLLGAALLVLAVRKFRAGSTTDDAGAPPMPRWMSSLTTSTPGRSFVTGVLLGGASPKNLAIIAAAALTIGTGGLDAREVVVAITVTVLVASLTVLVPVIGYGLFSARLLEPLEGLERWLLANHARVMGLLLIVFGVVIIGNGIASF